MALSQGIVEKISIEVIKTLVVRFEKYPEDASNNRNAPFHEAFLKAFADKIKDKVSDLPFFISLSSWMHGLNTTMGQSFFEHVAHILSQGEKREYTSKKLGNLSISRQQKNSINRIITDLSNSTNIPNLAHENESIFLDIEDEMVSALDFSADVFIEDDEKIVAIELKSVKPNSGEMRGEKQKILEGKAALFKKFPNKKIEFFIGFPFDPTSSESTSFDKQRFLKSIINMTKFFDSRETLLSSELWDFLSGEKNTMEQILEIINSISTTKFLEYFQYINDKTNIHNEKYVTILSDWNLFSEIKLVENYETIISNLSHEKKLVKLFNQTPFNNKGAYNWDRFNSLATLL